MIMVEFSDLCHTDSDLYNRYLITQLALNGFGAREGRDDLVVWRGVFDTFFGGVGNAGSGGRCAIRGICESVACLGVDGESSGDGDERVAGREQVLNGGSVGGAGSHSGASGVAAASDGVVLLPSGNCGGVNSSGCSGVDGRCGLVGGLTGSEEVHCRGVCGEHVQQGGVDVRVIASEAVESGPVSGKVSTRKEKNKRRRERRRVARSDVSVAGCGEGLPEWRRRGLPEWRRRGSGVSFGMKSEGVEKKSTGFVGYFDELSDDVKLELKESRARRLIAENKRKATEDEHKEKVNGDPLVESLRAVISMMQIEKRVGKLANDSAIGGWAKTVASAASKTTASEQSSGGLSLASIGSTPPVDAGGLPLSQREVAYREALVRLHDYYDRRAGFSDDEVKADLYDLRETYADVCCTPAQVEKRRLCKAAETLALGMGHDLRMQEGMLQLIEKIFEEDNEDDKIPLDANFSKLLGRTYL